MKKKRRKHTAEFKARVALETINEIAAKNEVHPVQVGNWKKELLDRVPEVFERKNTPKDKDTEKERDALERKVGQLTVEVDWLEKKVRSAGDSRQRAELVSISSRLSIRRQCQLLGISRSLIYYRLKGESEQSLAIMRAVDELHYEDPAAGSRRMRSLLKRQKKIKAALHGCAFFLVFSENPLRTLRLFVFLTFNERIYYGND